MQTIRIFLSRIGAFFTEKRANREFDAELQEHIRLLAERFEHRGMSPWEAADAARRQFGNAALVQQRQRESRTFLSPAELWRDACFGVRMLRKHLGSTAAVVVALALGIGMNTCVFTFVNTLLLRPPSAVNSPGELREIWGHSRIATGLGSYLPLTYPDYTYFRDHSKSFSGILAYDGDTQAIIWNRSGAGEVVRGEYVSCNFFSVAGVGAAIGRVLSPTDDQPSNPQPLVVLGNSFWKRRLGADPGVLGKTMMLNGINYSVIGVAPPGFTGFIVGVTPDFWSPVAMIGQTIREPDRLTSRNNSWLLAVGRLAPGANTKSAQAETSVLAREIELAHPDTNKDLDAALFTLAPVPGPFRGYVTAFTGLLMAVFALVLVIACTNAAGLLLVKAAGRARELAIRSALGATRSRLVRQMVVESVLLSLIAACAAIAVAGWTSRMLLNLVPPSLPISVQLPLDWRVLVFTFVIALMTGILFGAVPALRGTRVDPVRELKEGAQSGGYRRSRFRSVLMIGQVAVCAILLFSATLCVRSLLNANSIDPGFDTRNVAIATLDPGSLGYPEEKAASFYRNLTARVRALPGVDSVSYTNHLPLNAALETTGVLKEGGADTKQTELGVDVFRVAPGYFKTMGVALLSGREFTQSEFDRKANAIVVNDTLAQELWPGQNPLGKSIVLARDKTQCEIIGVVKTGKYRTLGETPLPAFYRVILPPRRVLLVHTAANPAPMLDALRREVQIVDPNMAATEVQTIGQFMEFPMFPARVAGLLLGFSGILALVLTWIGLFGVISFAVSQRTREIGVRMAMGARRSDVLRLVMRQGLLVAGIGLVIGMGCAFAAARLLSSLLYGIRPDDPATIAAVAVGLTAVTMLACYIPARGAMRVDPTTALRYE
ncbi:MAG: ABC transporter permease [Terracidiphilus sp.]